MARKQRKALTAAVLIAAGAALVFPASSLAGGCPDAGVTPDPAAVSEGDYDAAILCLLNAQRTSHGLKPLRMNTKLSTAADGHSASMNRDGYFSHDEPNGSTFDSRITATGYLKGSRSWELGENIAWGSYTLGTPQSIMVSWMNSPPHRANILKPRFREIGVGVDWGSPTDANPPVAATVTTDFGYSKRR